MTITRPSTLSSVDDLRTALQLAFDRLRTQYVKLGGYRFHGWTTKGDPRNYTGPLMWSRADLTFRLALELEREFPQQVHYTGTGPGGGAPTSLIGDGRPESSIVVSNLSGFEPGTDAQEHLRRHQHLILVEVHWFPKGRRGYPWEQHSRTLLSTVQDDLRRLERAQRLSRCSVAAMLIVDDEDYFEDHGTEVVWPRNVQRLICGPKQLD